MFFFWPLRILFPNKHAHGRASEKGLSEELHQNHSHKRGLSKENKSHVSPSDCGGRRRGPHASSALSPEIDGAQLGMTPKGLPRHRRGCNSKPKVWRAEREGGRGEEQGAVWRGNRCAPGGPVSGPEVAVRGGRHEEARLDPREKVGTGGRDIRGCEEPGSRPAVGAQDAEKGRRRLRRELPARLLPTRGPASRPRRVDNSEPCKITGVLRPDFPERCRQCPLQPTTRPAALPSPSSPSPPEPDA